MNDEKLLGKQATGHKTRDHGQKPTGGMSAQGVLKNNFTLQPEYLQPVVSAI
jgi:hypothetical protein